MINTPCPICNWKQLGITTADDSNYKIVKCYNCGWWNWLKYFNKTKKNANETDEVS